MVCKSAVLDGAASPETPADRSNCCATAGLPSRKISANVITRNVSFFKCLSPILKVGCISKLDKSSPRSISNYGRLSYQQQTIVQNPMVSSSFHAFARFTHFVLLRAVIFLTVILENSLL